MLTREKAEEFLETLGSLRGGLDDLELQVREAIGPCELRPQRARAANGDAGDELAASDARAIFAGPDNWR